MKAWAYKDFKIGELFNIKKGKRLTKGNMIPGIINFVGSSASNHGITAKIANSNHIHPANTITVTYNGSVGEAFYQTEEFWASDDVNVLYSKSKQNESIALYFCAVIRKCGKKYAYAYKWTKEFMEQEFIPLPITQSGNIDYTYIESYVLEMKQARIFEMNSYLKAIGFDDCKLTEEEREAIDDCANKKVENFKIGDLYTKVELKNKTFDKRKDSRQIPDSQYCIPLVNAKHGDNGIMYYGDSNVFDSIDMTIDIVQNGAIATGDVYPQPQRTGVLWDAYLIRASQHQDNVETLLYISTAIEKSIKRKYTYDNKAYWEQVKNELIALPVTSSGEIDYKFMELYIRAQEKLAIQRIKDWQEK